MKTKARVFIAYSHKDEVLKDELYSHLNVPLMKSVLELWHDGQIKPGVEWERDIKENMGRADIILLLLSVYALNSEYFLEKELKKILQQHRNGESVVIPVILQSCEWEDSDLSGLQALPENGKPVASWPKEAQHEVLKEIANKVKERAIAIVEKHEQKYQELEQKLEKNIRDDQPEAAQKVLGELRALLGRQSETSGRIVIFEQRLEEVEKIRRLRNFLQEIEKAEEKRDWDAARLLTEQLNVAISPEEIARSKDAGLIKSLLSNIEDTKERIRRKSESEEYDAKADKAFKRKDYEEAKLLWEEAYLLENKSERIHRIRECEERIRNRIMVAEFESAIEKAKNARKSEPHIAQEILESAIQKIKDDKMEASEESERVKERLKAADQELEEIKNLMEINEYANLLKNADEALRLEQYHIALNHYLTAQEINPGAREEQEAKIQTCRSKLRIQKLREAAGEFEKKKEYTLAQGMYLALLESSPDDKATKQKIEEIDEILDGLDKSYARARAEGQRLLLRKQYDEAIKYFDYCKTIKPEDDYALLKKEEAQNKKNQQQGRDKARELLNRGKDLFNTHQFFAAKIQFKRALHYAPGNDEAMRFLKYSNHLLWAGLFFNLKWYGRSKQAYQNLSPEIRNMAFVEQRIVRCEQQGKKWRTQSRWYVLAFLSVALLCVIAIRTYVKMQNSIKLSELTQEGDNFLKQKNFAQAQSKYEDAGKFAQTPQDNDRLKARIELNASLNAAMALEDSAGKTQRPERSLILLDSAINLLKSAQSGFAALPAGTTSAALDSLLAGRIQDMSKRAELQSSNSEKLEELRTLLEKANSFFQNGKNSDALSVYGQASARFQNLLHALNEYERIAVVSNLTAIESACRNQALDSETKIASKNSEIGHLESSRTIFNRSRTDNNIRTIRNEITRLNSSKAVVQSMADRSNDLIAIWKKAG